MLRLFGWLLCLLPFTAQSAKYYVYFKDKPGMELDPYEYFHQNAIARRVKCNIPLVTYSDLPVFPEYVAQVSDLVDSTSVVSRWFNMITVYTQSIAPLQQLSFIDAIVPAQNSSKPRIAGKKEDLQVSYDHLLGYMQCERFKGSYLKEKGLDGKGVSIAVFDVGFSYVNHHAAFEHLNIAKTYDFVGDDESPYQGGRHGSMVLACIGGRDLETDRFLGLAPKARFLLARTESNASEKKGEEENWLAAAEWADKHGADVINSSLGYTFQRYKREEMDGKTTIVSRAAQMAFGKGIIVVSAAGNEGDNSWKYVAAPADADSVLSIGAIDPKTDAKIDYSSLGPNANYTMKPNLSGYGVARVPSGRDSSYSKSTGTSFASPLVAGFVACALQAFPNTDHHGIVRKLRHSGHLYPYFDYAHGYGVPQADKLFLAPTSVIEDAGIGISKSETSVGQLWYVKIDPSAFSDMKEKVLNKKNLYYHLRNAKGQVIYYSVKRPKEFQTFLFNTKTVAGAKEVWIHFEGRTVKFEITQ